MNCLTDGVPPAYIYFKYGARDAEETTINVTDKILEEEVETHYNRLGIHWLLTFDPSAECICLNLLLDIFRHHKNSGN